MKRILICGTNSYIGNSFLSWLGQRPEEYAVEQLDMTDGSWPGFDFAGIHAVFHVAALVHQKEKPDMERLYLQVNRDLPVAVAQRAKQAGVKQFVFMSSMSVYGLSTGQISRDTPENPNTFYGRSKLEAEKGLLALADNGFTVSIIRAPMVYGGGNCPGNYARLAGFARRFPVFPDFENRRSLVHIGNLCEFVRLAIETGRGGLLFPQDGRTISTTGLVRDLAREYNRKIVFVRWFNPLIRLLLKKTTALDRVFGDLTYDSALSGQDGLDDRAKGER